MGNLKEKYLSEAMLSQDPKKKLALKIADGAVTAPKIANGAVTTEKLANDAVTPEKLSERVIEEVIKPAVDEGIEQSEVLPEKVAELEERVETLEECCDEVKGSTKLFQVSWADDAFKSKYHVTIVPSVVKEKGGRIRVFIDSRYQYWPAGGDNVLNNLAVQLTGQYDRDREGWDGWKFNRFKDEMPDSVNAKQGKIGFFVDVKNVKSDLVFSGRIDNVVYRRINIIKTIDAGAGTISGPDTFRVYSSDTSTSGNYNWKTTINTGYSIADAKVYAGDVDISTIPGVNVFDITKTHITLRPSDINSIFPNPPANLNAGTYDDTYTLEIRYAVDANYATVTCNIPKDSTDPTKDAGIIAAEASNRKADGNYWVRIKADSAHTLDGAEITVKQGTTNIPYEYDSDTGTISIPGKYMVNPITIDVKLKVRIANVTMNFLSGANVISTFTDTTPCGVVYEKHVDKETYVNPNIYDIEQGDGVITIIMDGKVVGDDNGNESHGKGWDSEFFPDLDFEDAGDDGGTNPGTEGVHFTKSDIHVIVGTSTGVTGDIIINVRCSAYGQITVSGTNAAPLYTVGWANGDFYTEFTPQYGYTLDNVTPVISKQGGGTLEYTLTDKSNGVKALKITGKAYVPVTVSMAATHETVALGTITVSAVGGTPDVTSGTFQDERNGVYSFDSFVTKNSGYSMQGFSVEVTDTTTGEDVSDKIAMNTYPDEGIISFSLFYRDSMYYKTGVDPTHNYTVRFTFVQDFVSPTINLTVTGGKAKYGSGTAASSITFTPSGSTAEITLTPNDGYTVLYVPQSYGINGQGATGASFDFGTNPVTESRKVIIKGLQSGKTYTASIGLLPMYNIDLSGLHNVDIVNQKIDGKISNATVIPALKSYEVTLQAANGFTLQQNTVSVLVGSTDRTNTYNSSTGVISGIIANGNIAISATAVRDTTYSYANVTINVENGSATGSGDNAHGYTRTLVPDEGYQLEDAEITVRDITTNEYRTYNYNSTTGVFTLNDVLTEGETPHEVLVSIRLLEAPIEVVNPVNLYLNVVNARINPVTTYYNSHSNAAHVSPSYVTTYEGGKTVYSINSKSASTFKVIVLPPYDEEVDRKDFWDYKVTIDVKDAEGNNVWRYSESRNKGNFYKIHGVSPVNLNQYIELAGNGVSGDIYYHENGAPSSIEYPKDDHSEELIQYDSIDFYKIKSDRPLFVTVTFHNQDIYTNEINGIGKNNRFGNYFANDANGSYCREMFSFDALGRYIDPMLPRTATFDGDPGTGKWYNPQIWQVLQYGDAYRNITLGKISDLTKKIGLSGSTDNDRLADLVGKLEYIFIKKFGITNGQETWYDGYNVGENASTGCPFHEGGLFLDSDGSVTLRIKCDAADPRTSDTERVISSTYTSQLYTYTNYPQADVEFTTTNIDTHLKGSYHVSQLMVRVKGSNTVIQTVRLVREVYGIINCFPNREGYATGRTWPGNAFFYIAPSTIFTAKTGHTNMPDLNIVIKEHGTQTDANIEMAYTDDSVQNVNTEDNVAARKVDISVRVTPTDNEYPELTAQYNNFDMNDGITIYTQTVAAPRE